MSETEKKAKLFVAVVPALDVTKRIADTMERLRRSAQGLRAAWVPRANLHVTVKFLGWANREVVDRVRDALAADTEKRKGFDLGARGFGAFPNESSPRVLWAGIEDRSGMLAKLAADINKSMESLGFERDTRAFHPHVTIARVKEGKGGELLAPFKTNDFGNFLVREVVLYESSVTSRGSEYFALARLPLDAPAYRAERQTREVEGESPEQEEPEDG